MTDRDKSRNSGRQDWQGFREVDQAIAENRLTAYTWKKTWADPWGRLKVIVIFLALVAFAAFVIVQDVIL